MVVDFCEEGFAGVFGERRKGEMSRSMLYSGPFRWHRPLWDRRCWDLDTGRRDIYESA